jgi:hypothetical protein
MSIVLVGSTSGSCTLQEQAIAGNTVLTLPTTSGTVLTSATQSIPKAALPTGSVLQVVQAVYSGVNVGTSSATPVTTGFSASITPTSASSKILVIANPSWSVNSAGGNNGTALMYIYRGGSSIYRSYCRTFNYNNSSGLYQNNAQSLIFLDSPSTTSSTAYTLFFSLQNGNETTFQSDGGNSSITLMEIAA